MIPSLKNTTVNSGSIYAEFGRPFRNSLGFSVSCDFDIVQRTRVSHLFFTCSPPAISGLVVAIVVDSIKSQVRLWIPHVGEKVLKRLAPTSAYGNPPAPVVFEGMMALPTAPLDHLCPDMVEPRAGISMIAPENCMWRSMTQPSKIVQAAPSMGHGRVLAFFDLAGFAKLATSHVIAPVMALVRGPVAASTAPGFAIL